MTACYGMDELTGLGDVVARLNGDLADISIENVGYSPCCGQGGSRSELQSHQKARFFHVFQKHERRTVRSFLNNEPRLRFQRHDQLSLRFAFAVMMSRRLMFVCTTPFGITR